MRQRNKTEAVGVVRRSEWTIDRWEAVGFGGNLGMREGESYHRLSVITPRFTACTKMDHGAILKEDLFWSHIFCCCFILTTVNLRYFCDIEMEI